jgi:reductive dehalogenase
VGERDFESRGSVEGFTDYYTIQTKSSPSKVELTSIEDTTDRVKLAAKMFGAGMSGICNIDERWVYSHNFDRKTQEAKPLNLPKGMTHAIMIIVPMDHELSKTYPTALSGASTGIGYSTGLNCANTLAQFIVNLGYNAVASLNDTSLNIPMAIEAGLGEYGRHGLLINQKFGPNIRIAKVFTDLPLLTDKPVEFGVKKFCDICERCSKSCPVKAIPFGEPRTEPPNFSSHTGIKKWTVNAEKCFKFWVGMNTDCAICIRVCPYNKDFSKWWHRIGIKFANSPFRKLILKIEDVWKFGKRVHAASWWQKGIRDQKPT